MNSEQFRKAAHAAIDESKAMRLIFLMLPLTISKVANYYDTIADRRVVSNVTPGYLQKLLPFQAPEHGESWDTIQKDIESKIMPGLTHWFVPEK